MMEPTNWDLVIYDLIQLFAVTIIGMGIVGFTMKKVIQWVARAFS